MSYKLSCSVFEDYVHVCIDGEWPADKPEKIIADIYKAWIEHQRISLLLDIIELQHSPSVTSDYYNSEQFLKAGFRSIHRISVLDKPERKEKNDFFEITSDNRSMRIRFFYGGKQEAIDWLRHREIHRND